MSDPNQTTSSSPDQAPMSVEARERTLNRHPRPLGGDTARNFDTPLVSLGGLVLNNASQAPSQLKIGRKPDWIRARVPGGAAYEQTKDLIETHGLNTVCQEASCPNISECWSRGTATIMILGDTCTRSCGFCNVKTGKPQPPDWDEPNRVAQTLSRLNLKHVVITCVDRDDLPDGGASFWAETITRTHDACPDLSVEALAGDFKGDPDAIKVICDARPEILAHNLETVERMHPTVRPQAQYQRSLDVLRQFKNEGLITKTSIMVGIGERDDEVLALMDDIRAAADVDILTIGQYLQPTRNHLPIDRWVTPEQFDMYRDEGLKRGFNVVESGPLVRSSYHAEEQAAKLSPERRDVHKRMSRILDKARAQRDA